MNDIDRAQMASSPHELAREDLHASVQDPALHSMSLLNEIAGRYPGAVSFAPGWPPDDAFTVDDIDRYLRHYVGYLVSHRRMRPDQVRRQIFQYGPTSGIIGELVARYLAVVEGIDTDPRAVVITTGCQEAMVVVLRTLFSGPQDVLLVQSPCYFGIAGAAKILGIATEPVPEGPDGLEPAALASTASRLTAAGRRPRALYVVPDYANPSGATLSPNARDGLRAAAADLGLLILEDNPYGFYTRSGPRMPAIKAGDTTGSVIYLGSFAKTCFPGARIGYIVADQPVSAGGQPAGLLADELTKVKSVITINTSAISQAVVGGMLIAQDFELPRANAAQIETARHRLNTLLAELGIYLGPLASRNPELSWNSPAGGFFVVLRLPFAVDIAALEDSAARFGVLWTPMSLFYAGGGERHMRLAASYATPAQITVGVQRLANFIAERLATVKESDHPARSRQEV